jgi:excisionase family DNA binding protein
MKGGGPAKLASSPIADRLLNVDEAAAIVGLKPRMSVTTLSPPGATIAPRLLTLKQGAAYVGVSYWTLRDLVLNGTIPAVRVPSGRINSGRNHGAKRQTRVLVPATDPRLRSLRKVLVDRADLDRLIAEWKTAN